MNPDNITDDSLADASRTSAADGEAAVDTSLTLEDLNTLLGKDFKDLDTAKKALKDTQSYVGKRKEDIAAEILAEGQQTVEPKVEQKANADTETLKKLKSLEDEVFFSKHPEYEGYRGLISKLGDNPADVVDTEEFKTVFEKGKVADEVAKTKSIAPSNSRLSESKNVVAEAAQLANTAGVGADTLAASLARGILGGSDE